MTVLERPGTDSKRNYRYARWRFYSYEKYPLFIADWTDLVFHHFKVSPEVLQPEVPFDLDVYEENAYVSLVGFRTTRMYVNQLGEWTRWFHHPLSHHAFLNVRTYVKRRGEPGIFFLKEYVNSHPAIPVGRLTYGLPYSYAHLDLDHSFEENAICGTVVDGEGAALTYRGLGIPGKGFQACEPETELEFLCERYSAFTQWGGLKRVFRILHEPWNVLPIETEWLDTGLLEKDYSWFRNAEHTGSYWTPGARNVLISRPRRIE